jgi:hypothetical protein
MNSPSMCPALLAHSIALLLAQELQGATVCPTPDQVRTHLRTLVRDEGAPGTIGRLTDEPGGVRLRLDDADGRPLGDRLLPPSTDCRALAAAAAVSLAVWQGRIEAGASESAPAAVSPARWALGLGGSLSTAPAGRDLGGALGLALLGRLRGSGPLAGQMLLEWQAERAFALGAGEVRSRRISAGLGVELGQTTGALRVAAHALVLGARLSLRGAGLGVDRADEAWEMGVGAGARVLVGAPIFAWIDLGGRYWPRPRTAAVAPAGGSLELPALEAGLVAGIGFGRL